MPTREAPQKHCVLVEQATHFYTCRGWCRVDKSDSAKANVPRPGHQIRSFFTAGIFPVGHRTVARTLRGVRHFAGVGPANA